MQKPPREYALNLKIKLNEDIISKDTDTFVSLSDTSSDSARQDAISALIVLGYSSSEAQRAVGSVKETFDDAESYIKHALKNLL